jgi:putative salt-induced outer membrane protein
MKNAGLSMRSFSALALMGASFVCWQAQAQTEEGFSGRVGLGYLATSGNTENESLNVNFDLWWNYDPWSHSLRGLAIRATTSNVTTANAFSLEWQSRYELNETDYVFGLVALDNDDFSPYDSQTREVIGYGRRLRETERHLWNAQIGAGARQSDLRDSTSQDNAILYLGTDYRFAISETSAFTQTLAIEHGSNNRFTKAISALSAELRDNLAIVISYAIRNNSDVLPGTKKTDTFTSISLEYGF